MADYLQQHLMTVNPRKWFLNARLKKSLLWNKTIAVWSHKVSNNKDNQVIGYLLRKRITIAFWLTVAGSRWKTVSTAHMLRKLCPVYILFGMKNWWKRYRTLLSPNRTVDNKWVSSQREMNHSLPRKWVAVHSIELLSSRSNIDRL